MLTVDTNSSELNRNSISCKKSARKLEGNDPEPKTEPEITATGPMEGILFVLLCRLDVLDRDIQLASLGHRLASYLTEIPENKNLALGAFCTGGEPSSPLKSLTMEAFPVLWEGASPKKRGLHISGCLL